MFDGNCEEAINFYKDCLDGEIIYLGRYSESPMEVPESHKDRIMHAGMDFWGGSIMASDHMESAGFTDNAGGSNVHLSLNFEDADKMDDVFNKLGAGGKITMPLEKTFWGDKFGMLQDKYGFNWMFSCRIEPKN